MIVGVSYHGSGCECCAFSQMVAGVSYHDGDYKCSAFSKMIVGVSYHAGECKCWAFLTWFLCVPPMVICKCWVGLSDMWSDISVEEDKYLHGY